jgi:hypothetical protein
MLNKATMKMATLERILKRLGYKQLSSSVKV